MNPDIITLSISLGLSITSGIIGAAVIIVKSIRSNIREAVQLESRLTRLEVKVDTLLAGRES